MGVSKLWELLLTIAEPLPIEQLEGQVLAVDASIWLVKIDLLFASAHERLKAFLSKIMLMRRHNILPLFVFDGPAPALKRKTLQQRARRRLVADELEAKKRSEIEVSRLLEGESSRGSQQLKRAKKREVELGEVNKTLHSLAEIKEGEGNEQLEKIAMQSEILNAKYRLLLQLTPQLRKRSSTLTRSQFSQLDLQSKLEVLQAMEQMRWKQVRRQSKGEDEESRLRRELVAIQKRSTVREMQDQLFRKMMQKHTRIEDGYEIVESIYNGRKIIQKRKIRTQQSSVGFALRKGKMKNDPLSFSHHEEAVEEPQDQFIAAFCSNQPLVQKYEEEERQQQDDSQEDERRRRMIIRDRKTRKDRQKEKPNNEDENSNDHQEQKESSQMAPSYFGLRQTQQKPQDYVIRSQLASIQPTSSPQKDADNPDNLPCFIGQLPSYQNFSNDNLQMQNLLTILGIPFLLAPAEAEAQCAALQLAGIVDGIITEDSDAFLFGGQKVYRGVFQNNIRLYRAERAKQKLGLDRVKLIIFALLLGCDYSQGVKGIGLVNAMEIIKAFPNFQRLDHFRAWAEKPDALQSEQATTTSRLESATKEEREFYELHRKFKNYWHIDESFSSQAVRKAFLDPHVLQSSQLQRLKQSGQLSESVCKVDILKKLLQDKLQLNEKELEHFMRVFTFNFTRKKQQLRPFGQFLARIKSKRLQKSIGE